MGVTVGANGLSIVHKGSGGEANATLPDVCLTKVGKPVVPIPYGNNAKSADLAGGTTTVSMDGGNSVAIKGSTFSKSTGDAGGDRKGVSSGTIEAEAKFISASPTVKFEGKGVCRLSDQMTMNKANTMCLGGAQNPSVSVTEEQEGTYTLDIECKYPNGLPYSNAQFSLVEPSGAVIGSGVLDSSGKASVNGLALKECKLVLSETQDSYTPNQSLAENIVTETYPDPNDFCTFVAGRRSPFWEDRVGVANDWGILMSPSFSDDDFKDIVLEQSRISSPYAISQNHSKDFSDAYVAALYHIQTDTTALEKYEPLVELLLEQVHENGDILRVLYQADVFEPPYELLAKLRFLGTGNTVKYLQFVLWTLINNQICSYIDELNSEIIGRLDFIQSQASARSLSSVEEGINGYKKALNHFKKALPDVISQIFETKNDTLISISAMALGSTVNIASQSSFATNLGRVNAVVYTKSNNLNRPSFVTFDDNFSD
ncbi:DUF4150 domain-containing protein [Vibrio alginolyticus]|uniref:DUF4150 domain-containing protein n=1 Tax=Vibrio alginolyticus TaxID=663 RepID=UPI00215D4147|nr:DUF4150 domain-containing protein [Vibrio alginolyticus]MCR9442721.1 DUF4150 domain-containing protein [Vibrio alginolyticus]MCR9449605.1 DUF4150 domain-containing protein [Vibrio alginolyticus]MCR9456819.1 DUF4150 domain-containing protein [Vibrio alginolyticus]